MKLFSFPSRLLFFICVLLVLNACEQNTNTKPVYQFQYSGMTMGTSFSIKTPVLPESITQEQLKTLIDQLLAEINAQMSTYLIDSELSRFNVQNNTQWQTVSQALFNVLAAAQDISALSNGAFDITVGPLVNLWGFGPDLTAAETPDAALIRQLMNQTGYKLLELDAQNLAIRKTNANLYLDLSALAKGYAVDRVAALLREYALVDYLVEIGGELNLQGKNAQGQKWRIAIEKPTPDSRMIQKILPITNTALATSGDYRNFFEVAGQRYSHTIDPRTGAPITHKLASITVLRHTTMEADALATALMVLGPEQGYKLAEQEQIAALFIIKAEQGFIEKPTSAYTLQTR